MGPRRRRAPAPRRRQRLRLRRHELPRRARGVHRRLPRPNATPPLDPWPAELLVWRGGLARRGPRRRSTRAGGRSCDAVPSRALADLAVHARPSRPSRRRAAADAGDRRRRRSPTSPTSSTRGPVAARAGAERVHDAATGSTTRERPLAARRQGRVPLPGPGLAVREHGARPRGRRSPRSASCFERADQRPGRTGSSSR